MLGNLIIESLQKYLFLIDLDNQVKYVVLKDPYMETRQGGGVHFLS